jgi:hypothetical protein
LGGALARPQAGLGAFVRVFGAVVEAVCSGGVSVMGRGGGGGTGIHTPDSFRSGMGESRGRGSIPFGSARPRPPRRRPSFR